MSNHKPKNEGMGVPPALLLQSLTHFVYFPFLIVQHGGLEISLSGFELAWSSVVFRVFTAVFVRLLVIQQRRAKHIKDGFH